MPVTHSTKPRAQKSKSSTPLADKLVALAPTDQSAVWVQRFARHLDDRPATDQELRAFAEPHLERVEDEEIGYRTVFTYMSRAISTKPYLKATAFMKVLEQQANLTDGQYRAPECSTEVVAFLHAELKNPDINILIRMGLWVQMARGGRRVDASRVTIDSPRDDGIYWRAGKNIQKTSSRKNVALPHKILSLLPEPPMTWSEWRAMGGAATQPLLEVYDIFGVNAHLATYPFTEKITTESIRDIYHRVVIVACNQDYEEATKYTIHSMSSTMLRQAYGKPREKVAHLTNEARQAWNLKHGVPAENAANQRHGDQGMPSDDDAPLILSFNRLQQLRRTKKTRKTKSKK